MYLRTTETVDKPYKPVFKFQEKNDAFAFLY